MEPDASCSPWREPEADIVGWREKFFARDLSALYSGAENNGDAWDL